MNSISALIITFNEEENIGKCISSLNWCDEIIVFDSYSTDDTIKIAESLGAKIFQNKFLDFGTQRELARSTIQWKSDWVISVDADEQVDEELSKEIKCIVNKKDNNHVAYKVRRKDYFLGNGLSEHHYIHLGTFDYLNTSTLNMKFAPYMNIRLLMDQLVCLQDI